LGLAVKNFFGYLFPSINLLDGVRMKFKRLIAVMTIPENCDKYMMTQLLNKLRFELRTKCLRAMRDPIGWLEEKEIQTREGEGIITLGKRLD
jgi:hypothetical protein